MPIEEPWLRFALAAVVAVVLAIAVAAIVAVPVRLAARRLNWDPRLVGRIRRPFRVLLLVVGLWLAVAFTWPEPDWRAGIMHAFLVATIAAGAWLVIALVGFLFARTMARYRTDVADNRVARRVHTQLTLLRRLLAVLIAILALGAILLTFPEVRAVGAGVFASAGLLSVVVGVAAQSTLANVLAGIQLAFSDAIRVDDVVIAEGEWGRIEEITLTYVVVHIWDDRRMVLPSTYFTTTPFQNWTRHSSELLGSVELDLDWRVAPSRMREQLDRILERTDLWDGRVKVLQVTDAVGGMVRVRVLVTAKDAPTLFDLRCHIREQFVEWLARDASALPVSRVQLVEEPAARRARATGEQSEGLFTGSPEAKARAGTFTAAVPVIEP